VLDYDVHLHLKRGKQRLGITVKELGNTLLRRVLSQPLLDEVIGQRLVQMGRLSPEEYTQVVAEATNEIRKRAAKAKDLIRINPDHTLIFGPMQVRSVVRDPDGAFQVFESRLEDLRKKPIPPHHHDEEQQFIIVLSGKLLVDVEGSPSLLEPLMSLHIPSGAVHSSLPLTEELRLLTINVPAGPDYAKVRMGIK